MTYDVLAIGRSSIDLYAHEVGRAIADVRSFDAYVGGCPTNVSVGTRRLGLRSALLTAVGDDQVGDFVTAFLEREQVETRFIPRKAGRRTSAVILTIQPPDKFPLTFYRDNCADRALTIEDVARAPIGDSRVVFVTGTGLSHEPSRQATLGAAAAAGSAGVPVVVDLDYRPDQWEDAAAFATQMRHAAARPPRSPSAPKKSSPPRLATDRRVGRAARRALLACGVAGADPQARRTRLDRLSIAWRLASRRAAAPFRDRGPQRARRRRRVRQRFPLRLSPGLAARAGGAHGQCLRRDCRHPPWLRQLHADVSTRYPRSSRIGGGPAI